MICRVCDGNQFETILDLGMQPWGNNFLKASELGTEVLYPLHLIFCTHCATAQLDYTVAKEVMFSDHTYLSGITRSLNEHFKAVAVKADESLEVGSRQKLVLDIGSNDGTLLTHFKDLGYKVLGVESAHYPAKLANERGIETLNSFFNDELAKTIQENFDIIHASGVFFHLEELHSVTEGVRRLLAPNGIFVVQFIYMKSMVENLAFDQIYHEHLLYYNLENIGRLLGRHGLEVFDAYFSEIHGGSIVAYVGHKGKRVISERLIALQREEKLKGSNTLKHYRVFSDRVKTLKKDNQEYINRKFNTKKRIYGLGAPVKGNTLLNYFEITKDVMPVLLEKNPLRKGLYSPGTHIPIEMEGDRLDAPDIYYVLAWNFKKEILENNQKHVKNGVEFYFPIDPDRGLS